MTSGPAAPPMASGDSVLFIRFSSLGDVLQATGTAAALKRRFPGIRLTWLVEDSYRELLEGQPFVDEVLAWKYRYAGFNVLGLVQRIRSRRFDWLVNVQGNDRAALISYFSGIPNRVGYHKRLQFAFDHSLKSSLESWGMGPVEKRSPELHVPAKQRTEAEKRLEGLPKRRLLGVVGASKPLKRWPVESWCRFVSEMKGRGWGVVLVGQGHEEERDAEKIVAASGEAGILNLVGRLSLPETTAVASAMDCVVGGDTGPLHLGLVLGLPIFGLFAIRNPGCYGFKGERFMPFIPETAWEDYPPVWDEKARPLAGIDPVQVADAVVRYFSLEGDKERSV